MSMRLRPIPTARASFGLAAVLATACAGNPVVEQSYSPHEFARRAAVSAYTDAERLGDRTLALLDRLSLPLDDPERCAAALADPVAGVRDRERLLAAAELHYFLASRCQHVQRAAEFLASACAAMRALGDLDDDGGAGQRSSTSLDPLRQDALAAASRATTGFLDSCIARSEDAAQLVRMLRDEFDIQVVWDVDGPWRLEDFDRWLCADTRAWQGLRHRYRRRGAGAPLIVERTPALGIERPLTPEAVTRAATAVLQPPPGDHGSPRLLLLNPRTDDEVEVLPGIRAPLAADFTAPFAHLLAAAELHALENRSFFDADASGHEGMFLLEDYDPERQPVVMVHGLWSSPLTWRDLTNDIFGDPSLHGRYQVWHYMYATGTPLLENARQLRAALIATRRQLDPELDDRASRDGPILVGHSMGGLLSRMVLSSSGDGIWGTLFESPFADVVDALDDEDRAFATELYFWEALPFVPRAIFIAAPHRGSGMSDAWIGRFGSALMAIPRRLRRLVDRIRDRTRVRVEVPTSVDELSMRHPVMTALGELQLREDLVYHSIMGDVSGSDDPTLWNDGVVPYGSSRLPHAASEKVIRGADHSVHFDARASAEVRRILREAAMRR